MNIFEPCVCIYYVIQWLEEEFLQWLDEWQQEVEQPADRTATEKEKMIISKETLTGLRMTGTVNYFTLTFIISPLQPYCLLSTSQ